MKSVRVLLLVLACLVVLAAVDASAAPPSKVKVSHTARQARPIQLGTSGGSVVELANGYCCSGTLGALVVDPAGKQYILSNTHVFAGDSVLGGNNLVAAPGDAINQPGFVDVGCASITTDYVADLTDWATIVPDGYSSVDAAIAQVRTGKVSATGAILEIGTISSATRAAYINQPVKKSGRTSGLTTGKVSGLNATISIQYEDECGGATYISTFTGQILVSPGKFLKSGDSGSLMVENVNTNPRAVGLLYAGSNTIAIANPIQDVLDEFGVTMVGTAATGAGAAAPDADAKLAPGLAKAAAVKERNANRLMANKNAIGHAVGLAKDGKTPVVLLLVEKTDAATQYPKEIEGTPVEVMEVGLVKAL